MKLGELLNKYIEKYKNEINLLENEYDKNNEKLNSGVKKVEDMISKKSKYEKKASLVTLLLGIPTIIGIVAFYIMEISLLFILFPASVIGVAGYAIYKKNIDAIDKEIDKLKNKAYTERKELVLQGNENNKRRNIVIEISKNLESTHYFFDACNRQDYLNNENNISEKEFLFCLENNISLLGFLYLVNSGFLSTKNIDSLSKDDLSKLRTKAREVDEKIHNNPGIFFNDENVKMMSYEQMRKREIAKNSNNEPMLAFDGRGFAGYVTKDGLFPVRKNRRSDKYIDENTGARKR